MREKKKRRREEEKKKTKNSRDMSGFVSFFAQSVSVSNKAARAPCLCAYEDEKKTTRRRATTKKMAREWRVRPLSPFLCT
jgi:hypothetical protein